VYPRTVIGRFVENVGRGLRGEVEVPPLAGAWFKFVGLVDLRPFAAVGQALRTKDICQAIAGKPISKLPLVARVN